MKILFVINPKAGGTDHEETIAAVEELVKARGFEGQFYFTTGSQDETADRRQKPRDERDRPLRHRVVEPVA
mgnify:CR=1 FL=1